MAGFENGVLVCRGVNFNPDLAKPHLNTMVSDGQLLIGSATQNAGGTNINVGTLTSPFGTITIGYSNPNITLDVNSSVVGRTITGNDAVVLSPSAGNWNIVGGVNFLTSGSGSTLTGRSDILTRTAPGAYPFTADDTNYIIEVDTSSARTINLPNAPTTGKSYVIKDVVGSATANNITVTTPGGTVTIDGATSYSIASNYASINVYFNGTSYFIF